MKKLPKAVVVILVIVGLGLLVQLVPYGRTHTNPPVVAEPNWDSTQTRDLAKRACFDCHSNEVVWPWYSNIAPFDWLIQRDVEEGRSRLNFSDWNASSGRREGKGEIIEAVQRGGMPPIQYTIIHTSAKFSSAELQQFVAGMQATLAR